MGSDQFSGGLISCLYRLISRHYEVVSSLVSSTSQILLAIESESAASEELNELSDPGNAQKSVLLEHYKCKIRKRKKNIG